MGGLGVRAQDVGGGFSLWEDLEYVPRTWEVGSLYGRTWSTCPGHGRWVLFTGGLGVRAQDVLERLSSFFGNRVHFLGYRSIR